MHNIYFFHHAFPHQRCSKDNSTWLQFTMHCIVGTVFLHYHWHNCTEEDSSASLSMELVFDDCDLQKQNYLAGNWHLQHCNAKKDTITNTNTNTNINTNTWITDAEWSKYVWLVEEKLLSKQLTSSTLQCKDQIQIQNTIQIIVQIQTHIIEMQIYLASNW